MTTNTITTTTTNPSSQSSSSSSSSQVRKIPLRKATTAFLDKRYTIATFYRPVSFEEEFPTTDTAGGGGGGKRTFLRRRTLEDAHQSIELGGDTDTKEIKERRRALELRKQKRQKQEEEYMLREYAERQRRGQTAAADGDGGGGEKVVDTRSSSSSSSTANTATDSGRSSSTRDRRGGVMSRGRRMRRSSSRRRRKRRDTYILEDEMQEKSFEGTGEETQDNKYFLFIMEGAQMRVLPVEQKWIHFRTLAATSLARGGQQQQQHLAQQDTIEDVERRIKMEQKIKREREDRFAKRFNIKTEQEVSMRATRGGDHDDDSSRRADEEIEFSEFFDDDEAPTIVADEVHGGYVDVPEEDEEVDVAEMLEMERQMLNEMGEDQALEESRASLLSEEGRHLQNLLRQFQKDPESLEKMPEKKEQAPAEEGVIPTKSAATAAAASKKRKEPPAQAASSSASASASAWRPTETSIPTLSSETSIPTLASEQPASKRQKTVAQFRTGTPASTNPSDVTELRKDLIKFMRSKGGRASLTDVRKHFIPSSKNLSDRDKQEMVRLLSGALKAVARMEAAGRQTSFALKPEFTK